MINRLNDHPRGTRGAFVEYTQSPPGLVLPFQFNPVQLQRNRSLSYSEAGQQENSSSRDLNKLAQLAQQQANAYRQEALMKMHQRETDLNKLREAQLVTVQEESISLEIRLDATDRLNEGDLVAEKFGIAPQLAILEQMICPYNQTVRAEILDLISNKQKGSSYTISPHPPLILFVWGTRWVLPVNINSMNITESELNLALYPIRATVAVQLTVIEGTNSLYKAALRRREVLAAAGMIGSTIKVTNVTIPE